MSDLEIVSNSYEPGVDVGPDYNDDGTTEPWTGGFYAGTGEIVTKVTGHLRDLVLVKTGSHDEAVVTITESHRDGGFCPTCSFEYVVFSIEVDGETVYDSQMDQDDLYYDIEGEVTPFSLLNAWLTGGTTN